MTQPDRKPLKVRILFASGRCWPWHRLVIARIAQYALVIAIAATINFALPRLAPGNPVDFLLPPEQAGSLTAEQRSRLLSQYGLDQSTAVQFKLYMMGLASGDLLYSVRYGRPVRDLILERLPWTLLLVGSASVLALVIGTFAGFYSGWRRGTATDAMTLGAFMLIESIPAFFLGMVLILLFAVQLNWFPVFGAIPIIATDGAAYWIEVARRLALPLLTATLSVLGPAYLVARSSFIAELGEDYVFLSHARLEPWQVRRHVARNALLPVWTNAILIAGNMLGGALVIETVFSYPGLGRLIYESVLARDYPVIQGCFFVLMLTVVSANFVSDLLYPLFDPRVRHPAGEVIG